jgi:hypothetical protein
MYVQCSIVARSSDHCYHRNAIIRSLFTVDLAGSNINVFIVVTEVQKWVPFALVWSCRTFSAAVDSDEY